MNPSAAIVIVNYNGAAFVMEAVESALGQQYSGALEIIVVDNASTDSSLALLRSMQGIRVIARGSNGGFGTGANAALAETKADYVALLNPDARAKPEWLAKMIPFMVEGGIELASSIIGAGSQTYFASGRYCAPLGIPINGHEPRDATDWLTGCALVASRRALDALGGFDEAFFLYYEDVDLSLRARRMGMRLSVLPQTLVDHPNEGSSTNALGHLKMDTVYYSRGRLIAKHVAAWGRYPALAAALTLGVFRNGIPASRLPAIVSAIMRGYREVGRFQRHRNAKTWPSYLRSMPTKNKVS